MTFFYDLNKKLAGLAAKTEQAQIAESKKAETVAQSPLTQALNESAVAEAGYSAKAGRAGKDLGKPGKNFAKIAKSAGAKYGSKAAGERVAGAVLNKLRHPKEDVAQEGNAFTGALKATPKGGKFKVGGKEFTDTSSLEEVGKAPMTPKQKSFAKLAPPADKITFADKIAGAKKEVDEMLGDVAAEAMRKAVVGHAGEEEMDEGYADMDAWLKKREAEKGTGKFDKKERTLPGGMKATTYTRKHEDDVEDDSDAPASKGGAPKKRGRPMGKPKGPERVTAKAWKHKGERKVKAEEDLDTDGVMMTRPTNCSSESAADDSAIQSAIKLLKKNGYNVDKKEEVDEKAVSKKQQKFMGMVHAAQKGEKPASKEVAKVAKEMPKKAAKDFAATKHKGLPEKVKAKKEESVEEPSTEPKEKKAKGGYNFGGGIYEGFDSQVEGMITESMSVNVSVDDQGKKSISVNATDADAEALAELLKMAGLGGQAPAQEVCGGCGSAECSCDQEVVDENSPDWPTDQVTSDDSLQYSGGLNKPKSTGQTTTPVIASQLRRQVSMEENVELERSLFKTWKNYKG